MAEADARSIDAFFTKPEVAALVVERAGAAQFDVILEPSAGGGVFLDAVGNAEVVAYDICPEDPRVERADFFERCATGAVHARLGRRRALALGNPPFGKGGALALKFLKACAAIPAVDQITMVLPLSFAKPSFAKKAPAGFALLHSEPLAPASFTLAGRPYSVPTCCQTWVRGAPAPPAARAEVPRGWQFMSYRSVRYGALFDLEVVRVGAAAGRAVLAEDAQMAKYNYFILLRSRRHAQIVASWLWSRRAELTRKASVATGPRSLSKPELTPFLNAAVAEASQPPPVATGGMDATDAAAVEELLASLTLG
jgi:hypothetical protein